jgi:ABC-type sugar transport system ATPase subunit
MISLLGQSIRKRYGATIALNGLNLSVNSGRIVGIAGPNGAGKSTLTRMLGGEETPDSGEIVLVKSGQVVADAWRRVAVVHQEPQVWPNLTVMENLAVGRESRFFGGVTIPRNAKGVLERLDIVEFADFDLSDLTLAVQQRVEIARAILSGADGFLFDEPNSALTEEE